jgi:2-polyprenyl-3-methyl-5-hydroxy-6-metoxy-1,4-benzoquinol methylase
MTVQPDDGREDQNIEFASTVKAAESAVAGFYSAYPYPWRAQTLDYVDEPRFYARFLAQELANGISIARDDREARIWVAGCGTNQAIITALHFPEARVVGSDISAKSLELAERTARDVGLQNLSLRQESLVEAGYVERFDLVICTGVIHHNKEPAVALAALARALKRDGLLELMVYSRFVRNLTSAFQRAVRIVGGLELQDGGPGAHDFAEDMGTARELLSTVQPGSWLESLLGGFDYAHEAALADALVNPVEHSFTVRSLAALARRCGLRVAAPCVNAFDAANGTYDWELRPPEGRTRERYRALSDLERWYVTNLVRFERAPHLWFYLQREDAGHVIPSVAELCGWFLETIFERAGGSQRGFVLGDDEHYHPIPRVVSLPRGMPEQHARSVFSLVDGRRPMRELMHEARCAPDVATTNAVRLALTTTQHPYTVAT